MICSACTCPPLTATNLSSWPPGRARGPPAGPPRSRRSDRARKVKGQRAGLASHRRRLTGAAARPRSCSVTDRSRMTGSWGWPRRAASSNDAPPGRRRRRSSPAVGGECPQQVTRHCSRGSTAGRPRPPGGLRPGPGHRPWPRGRPPPRRPGGRRPLARPWPGPGTPRPARCGRPGPGSRPLRPGSRPRPDPTSCRPVQLGLADVVQGRLGVAVVEASTARRQWPERPEELVVELLRHPEDLVRTGPADVVQTELHRRLGPEVHDPGPAPGPVHHQLQRLLELGQRRRGPTLGKSVQVASGR